MVVRIRAKKTRMRGSHTHKWGHKKKHRGSGSRGGTGMAGTGKRADHRKISTLKKYPDYFGKHGFHSIWQRKRDVINIDELPMQQELNLDKMGYTKLLSRGKPALKYTITVREASEKAKQKIEAAGGKINLLE